VRSYASFVQWYDSFVVLKKQPIVLIGYLVFKRKCTTYLASFVGSGKSHTSCKNTGLPSMPIVTIVTILLLGGVLNAKEG
jgi:hypothetical protein